MKVYCLFSLASPQQGDSNEYTQYTISQYVKENHPKLSKICNYGICFKGPKNEFETSVVNKPSVFEPLKVYCIFLFHDKVQFVTSTCISTCFITVPNKIGDDLAVIHYTSCQSPAPPVSQMDL